MGDPVLAMGTVVAGDPPVITVPKKCPDCAAEFQGNAITPLSAAEHARGYRISRCDPCIFKWEQRMKQLRTPEKDDPQPVKALVPPQRTFDMRSDDD